MNQSGSTKHPERVCETDLKHDAGLFQQVGAHVGTDDVVMFVKTDLDVLSKATAVVIASGFGISNRLMEKETISSMFFKTVQQLLLLHGCSFISCETSRCSPLRSQLWTAYSTLHRSF